MKFSHHPQWLLISSLSSPSLVCASSVHVRGNAHGARKVASPSCTIQVAVLLQNPNTKPIDDLQIDCEMDANDANGKSGQVRAVDIN